MAEKSTTGGVLQQPIASKRRKRDKVEVLHCEVTVLNGEVSVKLVIQQ